MLCSAACAGCSLTFSRSCNALQQHTAMQTGLHSSPSMHMSRAALSRRPVAAVRLRSAPLQPRRNIRAAATTDESFQILEAFYYGRAFAMTLSRKLGEAVVEVVSDISKAAAEQPQRWQEFQDEVEALAQQELAGARSLPSSTSSSRSSSSTAGSSTSGSSSSSRGAGSNSSNGAGSSSVDVEAIVDDMRADIAQARALLQQLKMQAATQAS